MPPTDPDAPGPKPPVQAGRPPKLDATDRAVIVALVTAGVSLRATARYVGVAPQTIRNTAERDAEFGLALSRARAAPVLAHARVVAEASRRSWRASAWALSRLCPERYGDPERRVTGPLTPLD